MSEDLNKLRDLAESLLEGQTGFADFAAFAQAQEEFQALTNPEETISLLARLQAAEERAEKLVKTLVTIRDLKAFGADADALADLIVDIRQYARAALPLMGGDRG